ncbi:MULTISPECIES: hypothetical protein [unclassified Pseudomonas]|uniref:hypothetical protein n=1 Tax=unclassified Pseudomonas TaxID=196821 RepID=UPI002447C44B|nr:MULTISPECIES: hypothetical protein [unclassified Pseudomonas]MDG9924710.1 hypothetical protein [Pseudomonas sp. GD04045]MDH0036691.1 hypothetical protein [Pseudomonas sp. GD04019]
MTHRHHMPARQRPAAAQRAPFEFASGYPANANPLRAATCPLEEEGGRVYIVIEDFAP